MRIAYVVGAFPSVSETFILDQITGLLARGHEVEIHADLPPAGAPVHPDVESFGLLARTRYRPQVAASHLRRLLESIPLVLRTGPAPLHPRHGRDALSLRLLHAAASCGGARYDAIHAHFGPNGLLAVKLRRAGALRGPIVTTFLGYDLTSWRGSYAQLIEEGDLFLPLSQDFRRRLERLGFPPERTEVQHLGVHTRTLPFAERTRPAGPVRLISVARLVEKKGLVHAIDAVSALRREGLGIEYTIVGDGPLRHELEGRIAGAGLEGTVRITGYLDRREVSRQLSAAHVLVAPSVVASNGDEEGTPVVLMEAMASGLPVVATRHSGIPEVVEDGVSGLLVPERDATALARAIRRLVEQPERWPAMGRAGRARIEADFDVDRQNDRLAGILAAVARGSGLPGDAG